MKNTGSPEARYPNAQEQQLVDKIATREKQIRMLSAGGVQAVIQQLRDEITELQTYLSSFRELRD